MTSRKKRPLNRPTGALRDARLIIIATEGEVTEKQYFSQFRSTKVQVEILQTSEGLSAPQHVLQRLRKYKKDYDLHDDDQLWLMIDVDRWPPRNLARVASQAQRVKFGLVVSNPCFELWLYLHFEEVDLGQSLTKPELERMLRSELGSYNSSNLDLDNINPI